MAFLVVPMKSSPGLPSARARTGPNDSPTCTHTQHRLREGSHVPVKASHTLYRSRQSTKKIRLSRKVSSGLFCHQLSLIYTGHFGSLTSISACFLQSWSHSTTLRSFPPPDTMVPSFRTQTEKIPPSWAPDTCWLMRLPPVHQDKQQIRTQTEDTLCVMDPFIFSGFGKTNENCTLTSLDDPREHICTIFTSCGRVKVGRRTWLRFSNEP